MVLDKQAIPPGAVNSSHANSGAAERRNGAQWPLLAPPQAAGETHLRFARSIIAGTLLSLLISVGFAYCRLALSTAGMSSDYITAGAVAVFFLLTAFLNPLLKLLHPPWGFNRGELAVVYVMLIIASTIPTWGFSANLIPMLPAVYYFATAENDWAELIHPHIHRWMVVQDRDAVTYFFEGLPEGAAIPWSAWVVPLAAWLTFIVAIYLMMIALMVLLRRQWVDHERLLFPLVQLPLQMIEEGRPGDRFGPFLKSPLMWVGFLVPFCLMSTHGLNFYFPVIPKVNLYTVIVPFRDFGALEILLSFTVLGLAYFLSFALASSLWVFHLLANLQMGLQYIIGYRLSGEIEKFMEGTLMLAHQGMGAMLALIAYGIWTARDHLKAVALKVWRSGPNAIDDSGEMLSYRAAALLLGVCSLYATVLAHLVGGAAVGDHRLPTGGVWRLPIHGPPHRRERLGLHPAPDDVSDHCHQLSRHWFGHSARHLQLGHDL